MSCDETEVSFEVIIVISILESILLNFALTLYNICIEMNKQFDKPCSNLIYKSNFYSFFFKTDQYLLNNSYAMYIIH